MPCRTAPAWPLLPPPFTVTSTSNRSARPADSSDWRTIIREVLFWFLIAIYTKYFAFSSVNTFYWRTFSFRKRKLYWCLDSMKIFKRSDIIVLQSTSKFPEFNGNSRWQHYSNEWIQTWKNPNLVILIIFLVILKRPYLLQRTIIKLKICLKVSSTIILFVHVSR